MDKKRNRRKGEVVMKEGQEREGQKEYLEMKYYSIRKNKEGRKEGHEKAGNPVINSVSRC